MTAAARSLYPWDSHDYLLPDGTVTVGVRIRCGCEPKLRGRNVHVTEAAIIFFRQFRIPPDLVVESFRCHRCKQTVKITARMLYFAGD